MPLAIAGALQDPPVSSHSAQGANLAATDAADPALLPACKQHTAQLHDVGTWCVCSHSGKMCMRCQRFLSFLAIAQSLLQLNCVIERAAV